MERIKLTVKNEAVYYAKNKASEWEKRWFNPVAVFCLVLFLFGLLFATLWHQSPSETYKTANGVIVKIESNDGSKLITVDGQEAEYQRNKDYKVDKYVSTMIVLSALGGIGIFLMVFHEQNLKEEWKKEYLVGLIEDKQ